MNALVSAPTVLSPADSVSTPARLAPPSTASPTLSPAPVTLPALESTHVWGLDFARLDMEQVIVRADQIIAARSCRYFITANLNYLMLSEEVPELARVNAAADAIIADGYPIVLRSRVARQPLPGRVAGSDMIVELARMAAEKGYRIFFLGAAPGVAAKAAAKLQHFFPELQVAGCYAPPYRALSDIEHRELLAQIRDAAPDILLVAFGQPKGERWIYENHQALGVPLSIQLGASFDFLAGTARRAPAFWQAIGCEWLYRSLCEPRRLAPRYMRNIRFLLRKLASDCF